MADHARDSRTPNARSIRRRETRIAAFALAVLGGLAAGIPASAAQLVQVRVGEHPTFTRVVFELDAPSGYRMERHAAGEASNTILVTIDAGSSARSIASKSPGVESVRVDAGADLAIAHIAARESGWPIKEMILADPPRIVLDLMIPGTDLLAQVQAPAVEPAEAPAPLAEARPRVVADEPAALSEPAPPVVATPEPAPDLESPRALAEAPVAPASEESADEPEPANAEPEDAEAVEVVEGVALSEPAEPDTAAPATPVAETGESVVGEAPGELAEVPPILAEVPGSVPAPSEPVPADASGTGSASARFDLATAGTIAGGALALLLVVFLMLRHRRAQPEGMDVVAMAEAGDTADEAGANEQRIPEGGFDMEPPSNEELPPETFEPAGDSPLRETEAMTTPGGSGPEAGPGIFDEALEEKEAMDMDNQDLPITHIDPEAPTQMGVGAAGISGVEPDISHLFQEFERRIAHLEARLDEAVDARERLERQVSAQTEELRVQRAAIARTQRALRSLNRSEEEQATEPALRNSSEPIDPK